MLDTLKILNKGSLLLFTKSIKDLRKLRNVKKISKLYRVIA